MDHYKLHENVLCPHYVVVSRVGEKKKILKKVLWPNETYLLVLVQVGP